MCFARVIHPKRPCNLRLQDVDMVAFEECNAIITSSPISVLARAAYLADLLRIQSKAPHLAPKCPYLSHHLLCHFEL